MNPFTRKELFSVAHRRLRQWKPLDTDHVIFQWVGDRKARHAFTLQCPRSPLIVDYFTSLLNFVKQMRVQEQTDEIGDWLTRGFATTAGSSASTMSVLMRNDRSLLSLNLDDADGDGHPSMLPRAEPAMPQRATFTNPDDFLVPVRAGEMGEDFGGWYDPKETGWECQDLPDYPARDNLIEDAGCSFETRFTKELR